MLIPYRVKNPVRRFPFITVSIIAVNVIVYAFTTEYFWNIRPHILKTYGFAPFASPTVNMFTAAFLHGDLFHLIGNMLFLWIFGPPVEERLGIFRYLLLYFLAGFVGDMFQAGLDVFFYDTVRPIIGASGCIMGVVGAYWYLFPWSKVCAFYWISWYWHGVWEVEAIYIIGLYILFDLAQGLFFGAVGEGGSIANFAHVGGGLTGMLLCFLVHAKRDTEALSEAKAIQADARDLENMPLYALQTMLEEDPGDAEVIRAAIKPAIRQGRRDVIDDAMARAGPSLIDKDPIVVAYYLLGFGGDSKIYKPVHLLHLARLLENIKKPDWAIEIYRLIAKTLPNEPEAEVAFLRMAFCLWNVYKDAKGARAALNELVARYPESEMIPFGRSLLKEIK